jgi:hypothetical protein
VHERFAYQAKRITMYSATAYAIRRTTEADAPTLRRLAELDSQRPLDGPALIGEILGRPAAAVSLTDGRVIADPFTTTVHLRQILRMRFDAFRAYSRTPSLSQRLRAGIRTVPITSAATG